MSQQQTNNTLADPFAQIFVDRAEADWAFDFLQATVKQLGLSGTYDERFALTLVRRAGKPELHLTFGGWLVVGFAGPEASPHRVELTLLAEPVAWDERLTGLPFSRKEGQPEVRTYRLPLAMVQIMTSDLQAAYEATLTFIADKFRHWKRPPSWQRHNPEIIEALFDPNKRARLFAGELMNAELRYERHLTTFYQDVSEEVEKYEGGPDSVGGEEEDLRKIDPKPRYQRGNKMDTKSASLMYQPEQRTLAEPFSRVFIDKDEAKWAFDFLKNVLNWLGVKDADDPRFALTLRKQDRQLRLNFGNWAVLSFYGPTLLQNRIHLNFFAHHTSLFEDKNFDKWSPFSKKDSDEPEVCGYNLPIDLIRSPTNDMQQAYETVLDFIAKRFVNWNGTPFRDSHRSRIAEAVFDSQELEKLLTIGFEDEIVESVEIGNEDVAELYPPYPLPQLAEETGLDEAELDRWVRAVERKGQAILYGPPGTGKTFIAEKLARHLVGGGDGFVELVQFHPTYAYEDFIQGIRPQSEGGSLTYPMVPGRFLEFCRKAATRRNRCVLILDEINRANLARVFGELMYLLEYRAREIPLAGGGAFRIPPNVRLIGTMNTADRSIALVDHALRRRFAFLALYPNYDLLRHYHARRQTGFPVEGLIDVMQRLNRQINDPHYEVGITFFLREDLAEQIEDIWRMEIEPYLEEYFFDQRETIDAWRWASVAREIVPS